MKKNLLIPLTLSGCRLDQAIAGLMPDYSRTQLQSWIESNLILVNGQPAKSKTKVKENDSVDIEIPDTTAPVWEAEALPLTIVYEDEAILVINKANGMVVHPGAGNQRHTLLNGLLHHAPALRQLPRAGILHRLDKNTSGLLIIAKTAPALKSLQHQLKKRSMGREYQAIVQGVLISGGTINAPIGRHPNERTKMAINEAGKPAITHYRIIERFRAHTHLAIRLETGRTHQIRVHMLSLHHPIVGDQTYRAAKHPLPKDANVSLKTAIKDLHRQALHASALSIVHPLSNQAMRFEAPLAEDILLLINELKKDKDEKR